MTSTSPTTWVGRMVTSSRYVTSREEGVTSVKLERNICLHSTTATDVNLNVSRIIAPDFAFYSSGQPLQAFLYGAKGLGVLQRSPKSMRLTRV